MGQSQAAAGEKLTPPKLPLREPLDTDNGVERFKMGVVGPDGKLVLGLKQGDEECELKGVVGVCVSDRDGGVLKVNWLRENADDRLEWQRCWFRVVLSTSLWSTLFHGLNPAQSRKGIVVSRAEKYKKFDLSRGLFYIRKIRNTERTEAPVRIGNFDQSG